MWALPIQAPFSAIVATDSKVTVTLTLTLSSLYLMALWRPWQIMWWDRLRAQLGMLAQPQCLRNLHVPVSPQKMTEYCSNG